MTKLTTQTFIEKSKLIHGDKYDYSVSVYTTIKNKIQIICPIHGEFSQTAEKHLNGRGCIKCGEKKCKQTVLTKYGVNNVFSTEWCKEKIKNTLLNKYGVDSPIKNLDIKNKIKNTCFKQYGVENPFQSKDIIQNKILPRRNIKEIVKKIKQTCFEKYGTYCYFNTELSRKRLVETKKEKILNHIFNGNRLQNKVIPLFNRDEYINVQTKYKFKCCVCNNEFIGNLDDGKIPRCNICFPYIIDSKFENEIIDYIKSLDATIEIIKGDRKLLNGLELDIYIPSLNLAIEFDGLYYHSELSGNKNKTYHLNKTLECNKLGIQLLHIFEDEWVYKQNIVKSKLKSLLNKTNKLYARKCNIKLIDYTTASNFLNENHLQGKDTSNIHIGLYNNDDLLSIMTFGPLRKCLGSKKEENKYEMYRFCNKLDTTIVGSASKLLNYFIKTYKPKEIISYADRRWSIGNLYQKLNFLYISASPPNYFYTKNHLTKYHRFSFRKDQLNKKLEIFDPVLSEWENMQINGWDRIWDCGCLKYKWLSNIN